MTAERGSDCAKLAYALQVLSLERSEAAVLAKCACDVPHVNFGDAKRLWGHSIGWKTFGVFGEEVPYPDSLRRDYGL